jgi:hypothetical protein
MPKIQADRSISLHKIALNSLLHNQLSKVIPVQRSRQSLYAYHLP